MLHLVDLKNAFYDLEILISPFDHFMIAILIRFGGLVSGPVPTSVRPVVIIGWYYPDEIGGQMRGSIQQPILIRVALRFAF